MEPRAPATFVSYARADSAFVLKLGADLKSTGANVWIDQIDIKPGQEWDSAIEEAVEKSPWMLVILSPACVASKNVRDEIAFALKKEKRIIPVLYQACSVPFRLDRIQYVDFRTDYAQGLTRLLDALGVEIPVSGSAIANPPEAARETQTRVSEQRNTVEAHMQGDEQTPVNQEREQAAKEEQAARSSESFGEPDQWPHLLKIGSWTFDPVSNELRGTGVYEFLLSRYTYGLRDYRIKARVSFANYRTHQNADLDTANAGIVLGWQQQDTARRYYNLLFTGRRMLLEAVGIDDYRDFKHFGEGVPFVVEDGCRYDIGISVTRSTRGTVDVFVDNVLLYSIATPKVIEGRVGLRPWRSEITCEKFLVFEA